VEHVEQHVEGQVFTFDKELTSVSRGISLIAFSVSSDMSRSGLRQ
jgi:hypothetical protein